MLLFGGARVTAPSDGGERRARVNVTFFWFMPHGLPLACCHLVFLSPLSTRTSRTEIPWLRCAAAASSAKFSAQVFNLRLRNPVLLVKRSDLAPALVFDYSRPYYDLNPGATLLFFYSHWPPYV